MNLWAILSQWILSQVVTPHWFQQEQLLLWSQAEAWAWTGWANVLWKISRCALRAHIKIRTFYLKFNHSIDFNFQKAVQLCFSLERLLNLIHRNHFPELHSAKSWAFVSSMTKLWMCAMLRYTAYERGNATERFQPKIQVKSAFSRKEWDGKQRNSPSHLWQKAANLPTAGDGQGYWSGHRHSALPGKKIKNQSELAVKKAAKWHSLHQSPKLFIFSGYCKTGSFNTLWFRCGQQGYTAKSNWRNWAEEKKIKI